MTRNASSIGLSCAFLLFGVLSIWDALRIRGTVRKPGLFDVLGPDNYFLGVGVVLLLLGVLLAASALRDARQPGEREPAPQTSRLYLVAFALTVLYALGILGIGYALATVIFFILALRLLGGQSWTVDIATSLALTLIFYVLFIYLADIPLPAGWL